MMLRAILLTLFVSLTAVSGILAGSPARLVGESRRTMERLDEIAGLAQQGLHDRAVDFSLRLMEQAGYEWVSIADGRHWITVRQYLLDVIRDDAKLAKVFRDRFDRRADELLRRGQSTRNANLLQQVVNEFGPTESAIAALDMLGDLRFEQGDFPSARHCWRQATDRLAADASVLRAKFILATTGCGEPTEELIQQWKKDFPDAVGQLGGRKGRLSEILDETLKSFPVSTKEISDRPVWIDDRHGRWQIVRDKISLPGHVPIHATSPTEVVQRANTTYQQLRIYPKIWRDYAVVADGSNITAISLATGNIADTYSIVGDNEATSNDALTSSTVTVAGPRAIARLTDSKKDPGGAIVCLDDEPNHNGFRWRVVWKIPAKLLATTGTVAIEGTPVVRDGTMFFSWTQTIGSRVTVWISAYQHDRVQDGPRWSKPIAELPSDSMEDVSRGQQVFLAGPNVVYSTDCGLIVAIHADTGQPVWAFRYESATTRPMSKPIPRPSVGQHLVSGGRLFLAPADGDSIFAIDVWTGRPVWPRPIPLEVVQFLGVVNRRLIVSANGQLRGLGAVYVDSGKLDANWGSLSSAPPFGRCVLMADRILYPTRQAGIAVIGLDGEPKATPTLLQTIGAGQLEYARGYLVLAYADELAILRNSAHGQFPTNE